MRALILASVFLAGCPRPEPEDPRIELCITCHGGLEFIHPNTEATQAVLGGRCVICHGGDGSTRDIDAAHVPVPEDYYLIRGDEDASFGYIKDFTPDQIAQLPPEYVRFINPGDASIVDQTCGTCHPSEAATMKNSIMTTNSGHYVSSLFLAGYQGRDAIYGSYPATDPDCDPSIEGSVCEVITLSPPNDQAFDVALASGDPKQLEQLSYQHYLSKKCNHCHAAGYGKQNSPHLYRSSGCTSCHMLYDTNGTYLGDDPTVPKGVAGYSAKHEITSAIPVQQCTTCHFQGGRIGLSYQGIRDAGGLRDVDCEESMEPGCDVIWNETAFGHAAPYYVLDEDGTNDIDETPPDIHYEAGLSCVDCHVGSDVHGDGRLYTTSKLQVDLKCEDCHGTVRQAIVPDAEGVFRTSKGRALPQLSAAPDGSVVLTAKGDGEEHPVAQVAVLLAPDGDATPGMRAAMGPDANDFTHTESLTCDTCHTSWAVNCLGCHVSLDRRFTQKDFQTGLSSKGLVRGGRQYFSIDSVLLGTAPDGRVQTAASSSQVQLSVIDEDRTLIMGEEKLDENGEPTGKFLGAFRDVPGAPANIGFVPFFHHTTSSGARARKCRDCHPTDSSPEELARVKGVYGFGTGEFMLENPYGPDVDALQFLDQDGNPITTWVHRNTGPVAEAVRNNALSTLVPAE